MPYKYCSQCNKRMGNLVSTIFCSDNCEKIYNSSPEVFCTHCKTSIGKESVIKTRRYCSSECHNQYQKEINKETRNCIFCKTKFIVQKSSHRYKLCSSECELKYMASETRNKKRVEAMKVTKIQRYGDPFYANTSLSMKTKLERYGVKGYNNSIKSQNTKLERYGDSGYCNSAKARETKLKRYGVAAFPEKSRETTLKKYGTLNFTDKANTTKIERYGSLSRASLNANYKRLANKYKNVVVFMFSEREYDGSINYKRYNFKCKTCNNEFEGTMGNGLIPRCSWCYPTQITSPSRCEIEIVNYLRSIYTKTILERDVSILGGRKEIDIYLPEEKIAIEYDGLYWHSECQGEKDASYHLNKTEQCEKKGIHLIHIFENEWNGKKEILKNKIKHLLHLNTSNAIYARKCVIRVISNQEKNIFLKKYHIQGRDNSSIGIGAFYENNLVSVMTFGKLRIALGNKNSNTDEYELYRFCVGEQTVVGVADKLFKYFIKNHSPKKVITYANRRYSSANAFYPKLGFKLIGNTPPNYWYLLDNYKKLVHRFNFRKSELSKKIALFDPGLTEWKNMQLNGYDRIWDCGNLKYVWKPEGVSG